jgi:hypothetical protein
MNDLTIIYYTSNRVPVGFMANTQKQLLRAVGDTPIISVSQKPMDFGQNICVGDIGVSAYNIYLQILTGVREAKTKYVATAEDDVLYPPEHYAHRPTDDDTLAYDLSKWSIFTWTDPPIYSFRDNRRTMTSLIAPRETLLRTLEERYAKYPTVESIPKKLYEFFWGEPGRFENHLRIHTVKTERFRCAVPSIIFSHPQAYAFAHLGTRKKHSSVRATEVAPWGKAEDVLKLYCQ